MKCPRCNKRAKQKHFNAKWCLPCAMELRKKPATTLTPSQIKKALKLVGKKDVLEIAEIIGSDRTSLRRWARDEGISLAFHTHLKNNPALVRRVCLYYSEHGMPATKKKFPNIKVRSIVERYVAKLKLPPRQIRWTGDQLIQLARFGGIASKTYQANFFRRPNANDGSINSAWAKIMPSKASYVNGLPHYLARGFVKLSCPLYGIPYHEGFDKSIALWIDAAEHMKDELPDHIKSAIAVMAKFQKWLHGKSAKAKILKILEEQR